MYLTIEVHYTNAKRFQACILPRSNSLQTEKCVCTQCNSLLQAYTNINNLAQALWLVTKQCCLLVVAKLRGVQGHAASWCCSLRVTSQVMNRCKHSFQRAEHMSNCFAILDLNLQTTLYMFLGHKLSRLPTGSTISTLVKLRWISCAMRGMSAAPLGRQNYIVHAAYLRDH